MQHFPLTEKLHTDILEEKYGKISSKVLKHNDSVREALLVDPKGIARTYAVTFMHKPEGEIVEINDAIRGGRPIGKAFRDKGYVIRKNVLDVFIVNVPAWLKKEFDTKETKAKARLSEFYAKKDGESPVIYGIVTEVYAPDFRPPKINAVDKAQVSPVTAYLEREGFSKDEIWRRIGNDNNYDDKLSRYKRAKENSKDMIMKFRTKVKNEIASSG